MVHSVLVERKSDDLYFEFFNDLWGKILNAVSSNDRNIVEIVDPSYVEIKLSKLIDDVRYSHSYRSATLYLEISSNARRRNLVWGQSDNLLGIVQIWIGSDKFYNVSKMVEFVDADSIVQALKIAKSVIAHELRHTFDELGLKLSFSNDLDTGSEDGVVYDPKKYFNSEVEMNAYITNTMSDVIDEFESSHEKTKSAAREFVPNGSVLFDRFLLVTRPEIKKHVGTEKWMKRAAPRMSQLWEKYVDKLPD